MPAEGLAQGGEGFGAAVAGEAVGFGADDEEIAAGVGEEFEELRVALSGGDGGVDKADAEGERGAVAQVRLDEFGPFGGDRFGDFRVAVAGQVGEEELGRAVGRGREREKVDGTGAARRGGDASLLRAEERIDEAGFSHVRAAEEGDFRHGGRGKVRSVGGGAEELGVEGFHAGRKARLQETGLTGGSGGQKFEKKYWPLVECGGGTAAAAAESSDGGRMKGTIRSLIASIVFVSVLTVVGPTNAASQNRTDASLRALFFAHRADFEKLRAMAEKDVHVTRIAPDFTWLDDNVAWPRKDIGFSVERWDAYRALFRRLELPTGISRGVNPPRIIFPVVVEGLVPTGDTKGFVYSQAPVSPLVRSLDKRLPNKLWDGPDRSHVLVYEPLEGHWYLYYEQW